MAWIGPTTGKSLESVSPVSWIYGAEDGSEDAVVAGAAEVGREGEGERRTGRDEQAHEAVVAAAGVGLQGVTVGKFCEAVSPPTSTRPRASTATARARSLAAPPR